MYERVYQPRSAGMNWMCRAVGRLARVEPTAKKFLGPLAPDNEFLGVDDANQPEDSKKIERHAQKRVDVCRNSGGRKKKCVFRIRQAQLRERKRQVRVGLSWLAPCKVWGELPRRYMSQEARKLTALTRPVLRNAHAWAVKEKIHIFHPTKHPLWP